MRSMTDEVLEVEVEGSTIQHLITPTRPSSVGSADSFSLREKQNRRTARLLPRIDRKCLPTIVWALWCQRHKAYPSLKVDEEEWRHRKRKSLWPIIEQGII